jgi:hypothetical protein
VIFRTFGKLKSNVAIRAALPTTAPLQREFLVRFGNDRDENEKSGLSACMDRFLTGRSGGNQFYTKKVILITR